MGEPQLEVRAERVSRADTKKPGAVSRIARRVYPTCAGTKKPIAGKPEIGAHFVSFNFTNSLICGILSSVELAARSSGAIRLHHPTCQLGVGPKNIFASACARRCNSAMHSLSPAGFFTIS